MARFCLAGWLVPLGRESRRVWNLTLSEGPYLAEPDSLAWLPKKPPHAEGPTLSGSPFPFQLVVCAVPVGESRGVRSP